MSDKSAIEWTDATWNPVTGCTEVSPGCDHCYAKTFAERWRGTPGHHFEQGFDVQLRPERLDEPMRWKKPRRIFVNSMSDLFHADIPDAFIREVFITMGCAPRHTFQVLTKRPERMRRWVRAFYGPGGPDELRDLADPMPNAWLGVSIESNEYAWRADMLRDTPAAIRFLSIEPMLGPIDQVSFEGIDWVIVGGESGHGARPMNLRWSLDVRDRCIESGIPFFYKQHGEFHERGLLGNLRPLTLGKKDQVVLRDGRAFDDNQISTILTLSAEEYFGAVLVERVGKKNAGRVLDGRTWDQFPSVTA